MFSKIFFWCLAVSSLLSGIRVLLQDKPASAVIITLLIIAGLAAFLAIGGFEIIRRIHRIGPAGVEIETWQDIDRILSISPPAAPQPSFNKTTGPWLRVKLDYKQKWFYERGTSTIFHLQHRGVEPDVLPRRELEKFRKLVLWVGGAALNENPFKALEILKLLEPIKDSEKKKEELLSLGHACVLATQREKDENKKKLLLEDAKRFLETAQLRDSKDAEILWLLGWVYDEMGLFDESIKVNEQAIMLNPDWKPWARWVIAVSYLKKDERWFALRALADIPRGVWWDQIHDDPELKALQTDPTFIKYYNERKTK